MLFFHFVHELRSAWLGRLMPPGSGPKDPETSKSNQPRAVLARARLPALAETDFLFRGRLDRAGLGPGTASRSSVKTPSNLPLPRPRPQILTSPVRVSHINEPLPRPSRNS